jgi:hypothetical protein
MRHPEKFVPDFDRIDHQADRHTFRWCAVGKARAKRISGKQGNEI